VTFGPALKFERGEGSGKKEKYEAASREMMAAIARLRDAEVGGAGMNGAQRSLQIH
jgi:hypothetical protein